MNLAGGLRVLLQAIVLFWSAKRDCEPEPIAPVLPGEPGPEDGLEPVPPPKAERPKMKLEIYEDDQGYWRWRFRAKNSKIVAESGEGFAKKANAIRAVKAFAERLPDIELVCA